MTFAVARRLAVLVAVAALTWAMSTVRHDDVRVVAGLAVLVETAVLTRLAGRSSLVAVASGALAGGTAALVAQFVRTVFGPAYKTVEAFLAKPWLAPIIALAFGALVLIDLKRSAAEPGGAGGSALAEP